MWGKIKKKVQELANTAWASATAGRSEGAVLAAVAMVAERRVSDFNL